MQTPTAAQIRTAIKVLNQLGERAYTHAEHSALQFQESLPGVYFAGRIKIRAIHQTIRIEAVAGQLKDWLDEIPNQRNHHVSVHI